MKIRKMNCPWCGKELEKPGRYYGTCEHCGKKYKGVVRYGWSGRYSNHRPMIVGSESVVKKETPLLPYQLFMTAMLIIFISLTFRLYRVGTISLFGVMVISAFFLYWGYFVLIRGYIDLVKVMKTEAATQLSGTPAGADVAKESVSYRKLFFENNGYLKVYAGTYEIEICIPQTGAWTEKYRVPVEMDHTGRNLMVKAGDETPEYLQKPGVEFKLYLDEDILHGITVGEAGESGNQFHVVLDRPKDREKLDENQYYKAVMALERGPEPYYMIINTFDDFSEGENHISYEVILFHYQNDTGKLPVPTAFQLYASDGEWITEGMVDCFYRNRNIIKREVPKELIKWY